MAEAVLQLLMDADVEGMIGYEHSGERTIWRSGHRNRVLDTRLGSLQLRVPKLRQGSYFPALLEVRKVSEKALTAVIQDSSVFRKPYSASPLDSVQKGLSRPLDFRQVESTPLNRPDDDIERRWAALVGIGVNRLTVAVP